MNPRILHHKVVMVLHALIISESQVSITVLCSPRYTAVQIKNSLKSAPVIIVATVKNTMVRAPQLLSETELYIALLYQPCSTHYTAVQIKNCL